MSTTTARWSSTSRSHPAGRRVRPRLVLAALAVCLAATGLVASPAAGGAAPLHCSSHPPRTAADFQAVADQRNASFGVGDITSVVRLPDGRRFFTLGDTAYYNV